MKRLIIGLFLVTLLLVTAACAAAPVSGPAPSIISEASKGAPFPTPSPVPAPSPAPPLYDEADRAQDTERKIVRTGDLSLVVEDVLDAIEQISRSTDSFNGYIVSSRSWQEGERLIGAITVRIPAGYFNDAVRVFRGLAVEVTSESTSSKDVTEEYVDLSAKLRNLEATEEQLLRLMEKADKVEDILNVQRELSRTRGEIEQIKGRMQYLERTSETSLIEIRLEQAKLDIKFTASTRSVKEGRDIWFEGRIAGGFAPYSYEWDFGDGNTSTAETPIHTYKNAGSYTVSLKVTDDKGNTDSEIRNEYITILPGWSAGNITSGAWNGLVTFVRVLANILIWLGIFSPVWIVGGGIFYLWWRRRKRKP
ncbi:DUF4349 domain-containing protein [Chloroflexota bacterium]